MALEFQRVLNLLGSRVVTAKPNAACSPDEYGYFLGKQAATFHEQRNVHGG
jgi:hypothetical protein